MLALAFLIALIVVAVNSNSTSENEDQTEAPTAAPTENPLDEICFSQACIRESAVVLEQMNQTVDPYIKSNLNSKLKFNKLFPL